MQGDGHDGDHAMGDEDAQGSEVGPDDEHYPHDNSGHPLVNGHSYTDASGSQQHVEVGAVPAAPPATSNQNSQETVSSTPHPPGGSAPPPDTSSTATPDASAQSHGPNDDPSQTASVRSGITPLQAMDSMASTVPDTNQEQGRDSPYASTVIEGGDNAEHQDYEPTQAATQYGDEQNYGAEDAGSTALNGATASNVLGEKIPSANRLSVSYAGATRRLVIDAEVVPKLKVFRAEGRIEVTVSLMADERGGYKGIAVSRKLIVARVLYLPSVF